MALKLAFIEGVCLLAAASGAIFLWAHPLGMSWFDSLTVLGKAFTIPLCCAVAFYYTDLYDLRIVPSFGRFASRLLQASSVAFMLLAGLYWLLPTINISTQAFTLCLLFILLVLLGLRALTYGLMRQRPFLQRVLILGTSSLAHKLIREIDTHPHLRYTIVGVADASTESNGSPLAYPLLGPSERLDKIIQELQPDRVIVALAERRARLPV